MYTTTAAVVVCCITFAHPAFWIGTKSLLSDLFVEENLLNKVGQNFWADSDLIMLLSSAVIIRMALFLIFVTTPVPAGVFAPSVILGALVGRLYAEVMNRYFNLGINTRIMAVGGAAATTAAITRTTSPTLILLELTGEMNFSLGLFLCVLFGYSVSSIHTMSIFDTILNIKKLPYLPVLYNSNWNTKVACQIMSKTIVTLDPPSIAIFEESTLLDLVCLFVENKSLDRNSYIPVVKSIDNRRLVGSIRIQNAVDYLVEETNLIEERLMRGRKGANFRFQNFFDEIGYHPNNKTRDESELQGLGTEFQNYINELIKEEVKYDFTGNGIVKVTARRGDLEINKKIKPTTKENLDATIKEVKSELDKQRLMNPGDDFLDSGENQEHVGRMSKKSMQGNPENYFQFFKHVMTRTKLDKKNTTLRYNSFPTSVEWCTKVSKIHYLFQMLGVSVIYVRGEEGLLSGEITKENFLNYRYQVPST